MDYDHFNNNSLRFRYVYIKTFFFNTYFEKKKKKNIETSFFRWFLISQLKYSREDIEEYLNKSHENAIILSYSFVCLFCFSFVLLRIISILIHSIKYIHIARSKHDK